MSLKEVAAKVVESRIWRLTLDGKVIGFRVKCYDIQTDKYLYFDFETDIVKNIPEYLEFFKGKYKSFESLQLISSNGRLYTKEELDGVYSSSELVTPEDTTKVLKPVILLFVGGVIDV